MRVSILALLLILSVNAAVFTLGRELVSGTKNHAIKLFPASDVKAAEYILENTEPDAVFLTASNHNNAVAALTGRNILCGSPSYLFYHGLDYGNRLELAKQLLTDSALFERMHETLGIDYVYIGDYERALPNCCVEYFEENYPLAFACGSVRIYIIS